MIIALVSAQIKPRIYTILETHIFQNDFAKFGVSLTVINKVLKFQNWVFPPNCSF